MINEARRLSAFSGWKRPHGCYWDQGHRSIITITTQELEEVEISVARMVDDAVTLLELLGDRFVAR
jgi:hypothetical protein